VTHPLEHPSDDQSDLQLVFSRRGQASASPALGIKGGAIRQPREVEPRQPQRIVVIHAGRLQSLRHHALALAIGGVLGGVGTTAAGLPPFALRGGVRLPHEGCGGLQNHGQSEGAQAPRARPQHLAVREGHQLHLVPVVLRVEARELQARLSLDKHLAVGLIGVEQRVVHRGRGKAIAVQGVATVAPQELDPFVVHLSPVAVRDVRVAVVAVSAPLPASAQRFALLAEPHALQRPLVLADVVSIRRKQC